LTVGDPAIADPGKESTKKGIGSVRANAGHLAALHLRRGDLDEGVALGTDVVEKVQGTTSARVVDDVKRITNTIASKVEAVERYLASSTTREATSNTREATHVPIGTVTRIGWNGYPYGPASSALTGCFAR
jgi:hypothetical protein